MIKKSYLFGLAVFCSLFVLFGCKSPVENKEPELEISEEKIDFASLKPRGFVPKVVRLGDSYINDKIESKAKKLSYEYYYFRVNGDDFSEAKREVVFTSGNVFHTATIDEGDAGDASKTKLKYEKIKDANGGGEVCIGTRFVLGLRVIDQSNNLVYHSMSKMMVMAPQSSVYSNETGKIAVPGNQMAYKNDVGITEGSVTKAATEYKEDKDVTIYTVTGATNKRVALKFGDFGDTNTVLVK